jgi:hypothetical protein
MKGRSTTPARLPTSFLPPPSLGRESEKGKFLLPDFVHLAMVRTTTNMIYGRILTPCKSKDKCPSEPKKM